MLFLKTDTRGMQGRVNQYLYHFSCYLFSLTLQSEKQFSSHNIWGNKSSHPNKMIHIKLCTTIHPCKTQRKKSNTDNETFPLLLIYSHYHNKSLLPDQDGDGILTAEEYRRTFHEHGLFVGKVCKNLPPKLCWAFLDEQWVNSMMAKIDLNGDGGISVEEFVELNMRLVKHIKKISL